MTNESNVNKLLEQLKRDKIYKSRRDSGKDQRATTMLSEYDFRRLKYISNQLGILKSTFIRKVLIEALNDAEEVLGLKVFSDEVDVQMSEITGEEMYEYTDYGLYIHTKLASDEDDDDSEGDGDREDEKPKRGNARTKQD